MVLPLKMKLSLTKHISLPEPEKSPRCHYIRDIKGISTKWRIIEWLWMERVLKIRLLIKTSFIMPGEDCKLQEKNISTKSLGVEERCACRQFGQHP